MKEQIADARPLWQVPVTYGAVGATHQATLLSHTPPGFRASERQGRIGHGLARWEFVRMEVMTWGIKRRAGFTVDSVDVPAEVWENTYVPVSFADDGTPIPPTAPDSEQVFSPDGYEIVRPGDTAVLGLGRGSLMLKEPVRVMYVIDEPQRRGFAYGTLPGHPLCGEESFVVEWRSDDSVWLILRQFSKPSTWYWWALYPGVRLVQEVMTRRYLRALAVPLD